MEKTQLPISALPAWCKLNDATFLDTAVRDVPEKGFGLFTERALISEDTYDAPTLLLIPHELVLSAAAIEEHAKVDHHFRQLLDAAGGKTLRGDILLFLLMQITIASSKDVGISNPWTEYVKILPTNVPVPTLWTEEERVMLVGTSLESALAAKMEALSREFDELQEKTAALRWCQKIWWEHASLKFPGWLLVDAWYRSRCLELPNSGESLVPLLDLANHSSVANAYYEETPTGVSLLLRPSLKVESQTEITISYGDAKSNTEMLFSYGFIDGANSHKELILNLETSPDDPLGKAKSTAFNGPQIVRIVAVDGRIEWECPFLYFSLLNEEDGLDFKIPIQTDGSSGSWRVFWQDSDVTDEITTFKTLIAGHELKEIFELRAVVILQNRIHEQLVQLYESEQPVALLATISQLETGRQEMALKYVTMDMDSSLAVKSLAHLGSAGLRANETELLEAAYSSVEMQKNKLLENENVVRYFTLINSNEDHSEPVDEDDFS